MQTEETNSEPRVHGGVFATTHWSVVLAAGDPHSPRATQALETLCRDYWYPLYAYVRQHGYSPEDAQDLTQDFFARLLAKEYLARADPHKGKFRSFLLISLQHFLVDWHRHEEAAKRGRVKCSMSLDQALAERRLTGEPRDELTPQQLYERAWAMSLLERARSRLQADYLAAGKIELYDQLKSFPLSGKAGTSFRQKAAELGLTEPTLKSAVHRMRTRYRQLVRSEVAQTVADPSEISEEARHLIAALSG